MVANDGLLDNITKYEYNKLGNITKLILGLTSMDEEINPEIHQITNYTYNNLNQLTSVTSPEGITTHFTYDYLGQNLSKYNDNVNTSYTYDGLGRVKEINATGNSKDENISYTYDLMGNIKSMTDSSGETHYTYNSLGQLIREVKGADVKEYTYDANGNRKTFKLNNEINLTYNYDILNRLTSVSDGTDTVTYSYDNNGNLLSENGAVDVDYQYNKAGQIISKINSTINGNIDNFSVSYFLNGNISDITENDKVTSYTYDNLGRLTKENVSTEGETLYSYDRFSNRNSKVETDLEGNLISQTDCQYNKNNQLLSEISGNRTTSYGYDINGNLTFKTYTELTDIETGGNTFTMGNIPTNYVEEYTYDALNRLSEYNKNGVSASYVYDGNGLRQSKTVNGITENHLYDGQNIVKSGNQLFFRGIHLISRKVDGNKEFYSFNVHGDTTKLTNSTGSVLKDYFYDAFGNQKTENENDTNPFRYCGEYFDSETGLIYLRARYYDPRAGRFISEDPIKDGLNWYVYCHGDPINFWDPSGLTYEDVVKNLDILINSKSIMMNYSSDSPEYKRAYQNALEAKENISNTAVYIEDWSGLSSALSPIIDGDNNSIKDFQNVKESVIQANKEYKTNNLMNELVFDGALVAGVAIAIKTGLGVGVANSVSKVAPLSPVLSNVDVNKINHIFNKTQHNLAGFLNKFSGNSINAHNAVQNAVQNVVNSQNLTGIYDSVKNPIIVNVEGYDIYVGGKVINGIFNIGTFYTK